MKLKVVQIDDLQNLSRMWSYYQDEDPINEYCAECNINLTQRDWEVIKAKRSQLTRLRDDERCRANEMIYHGMPEFALTTEINALNTSLKLAREHKEKPIKAGIKEPIEEVKPKLENLQVNENLEKIIGDNENKNSTSEYLQNDSLTTNGNREHLLFRYKMYKNSKEDILYFRDLTFKLEQTIQDKTKARSGWILVCSKLPLKIDEIITDTTHKISWIEKTLKRDEYQLTLDIPKSRIAQKIDDRFILRDSEGLCMDKEDSRGMKKVVLCTLNFGIPKVIHSISKQHCNQISEQVMMRDLNRRQVLSLGKAENMDLARLETHLSIGNTSIEEVNKLLLNRQQLMMEIISREEHWVKDPKLKYAQSMAKRRHILNLPDITLKVPKLPSKNKDESMAMLKDIDLGQLRAPQAYLLSRLIFYNQEGVNLGIFRTFNVGEDNRRIVLQKHRARYKYLAGLKPSENMTRGLRKLYEKFQVFLACQEGNQIDQKRLDEKTL